MRSALLLAAALAGCAPILASEPPPRADEAQRVALAEWRVRYPRARGPNAVRWWLAFFIRTPDGRETRGFATEGADRGCEVDAVVTEPLSEGPLPHEVGHCAMLQDLGYSVPDELWDEGDRALEEAARAALRARGL